MNFPRLRMRAVHFFAVVPLFLVMVEFVLLADCRGGDTAMLRAWHRTFHGPDALQMPLRGYFIPRRPNVNCWGRSPADWTGIGMAPDGMSPATFDRLGQIPNDIQALGAVGTLAPPSQ